MDFTTNDECGVLIDGYDLLPTVLTDWHHPYYPGLIEGAGLTKAMDLYMWTLRVADRASVHPAIWRAAAEVERKYGITVRHDAQEGHGGRDRPLPRGLQRRLGAQLGLHRRSPRRRSATTPRTSSPSSTRTGRSSPRRMASPSPPALTLPDYNQVLRHLNGRLLPFGWAKALWYRRKIDRVRVFALGVKPE